jgi:hypothetical protein
MKSSYALPVMLALSLAAAGARADADFTTLQRAQSNLDDSTPSLVVSFTLPSNVNVRPTLANSAVLDLDVLGSTFFFNRAYINPPSTTCGSNVNDPNESRAVGYLQAHQDVFLSNEWATNHITLAGNDLLPGANVLLVCIRDSTGNAGSGVTNLDAIGVRNVTLQYHTLNTKK